MASGDPVNSQANYSNGNLSGYSFGIGDSMTSMQNPWMMNPATLNPTANSYINNLNGVRDQYQGVANKYLNGDYYNQMSNEYGQKAQTSVDNNFARMGMAGSSAAAGAGMEAQRQNSMMWNQKQLQDAGTAANMMSGLDRAGMQGVEGIQGQYGQFQNSMADAYINMLNAQQGQANSENQMWGGIAGGLLSGAGSMMGGFLGGKK